MSTQTRRRNNVLVALASLPIAVKLSLVLIVVLAVSGLTVNAVAQSVVQSSQEALIIRDLNAVSRAQAFRLADIVSQEIVVLSRFAETEAVQTALLTARNFDNETSGLYVPSTAVLTQLEALRSTREEFSHISVINTQGVIIGIDPVPENLGLYDSSSWLWYTSALDNNGSLYFSGIGDTFIADEFDDGAQIAVPVYNRNNPDELIGVIFAVWNLNNVVGVTEEVAEREVTVLETDGTVLTSSSLGTGARVPAFIWRDQVQTSTSGTFTFEPDNGPEALYSFVRLDGLGISEENPAVQLRWVVLTAQDAQLIEENTAAVLNPLRLALGVTVLLSVIILLIFSQLLTRPLIRLTEAASRIGEGAYEVPIPQFPNDEVGRLADVIRDLVTTLTYRLRQMNAAVQVSRAAAVSQDVDAMMDRVTRSIVEQFEIPAVRVYLTSADGRRAVINAAIGPEADHLLRRRDTILINNQSLVGRCIEQAQPQFGGSTELPAFGGSMTDPSELAVPLVSTGEVYGVLHMISDRPAAFGREDVNALTLIADQVASSLENARLFEQTQSNIREIEALNRRLTQEVWEEYLGEEGRLRATRDTDGDWPAPPDNVGDLVVDRQVVRAEAYEDTDGRVVLAAPLLLRGEAIGLLAVTRPPGSRYTRDEVSLMESIASRMALIAEGIRLVEESNRRAERELRVSEVSATLFQQTGSVENILEETLGRLGEALGSRNVSLRLGSPPLDSDRRIEAGENGSPSSKDESDE
ncbi:MAG: GAF domain-containing protein [Chloroflexi bacterium]|nr:GAF domain-containing protein [Chloroflexota bacterium]